MQYRGLFVGLTTIDIQYFVDVYPKSNAKVKTSPPDMYVGGPACNAAVAFSKLNNGANLVSAVGNNPFTPFIRADFKDTCVELHDSAFDMNFKPTIASVVTSKAGDRTIFSHNPEKHSSLIDPLHLFQELNPEIVLLDGFYPEIAFPVAQLAKEADIPVVMDGGSWKEQYKELLPFSDFVICSADFYPPACTSHKQVVDFLIEKGINHIAISRGEGSILTSESGIDRDVQVDEVNVKDTLGAGDFLHGAFCYYYLQKKSFNEAIRAASKLASYTCSFKGTRSWLNYLNKTLD